MKARIVKSELVRKILDETSPEKKKEIQDRIDKLSKQLKNNKECWITLNGIEN